MTITIGAQLKTTVCVVDDADPRGVAVVAVVVVMVVVVVVVVVILAQALGSHGEPA